MTSMDMSPASKKQVDGFSKGFTKEVEQLISNFFPEKIADLENLLQGSCSLKDLSAIQAPLDIPIPDPAKEELKRKKKEEKEAKEGKKKDDKKEDEDEGGPPCGPIACNETIEKLLKLVKPEIQTLKECLIMISSWIQLQVPRIEDGNNFGVAVQEKIFESLTNIRTRIEAFQTQISKYYSERGDAVAKASKQQHVGDYRQLVHELDQYQYRELRIIVLEIRDTYAVLFDAITKNLDKIKKPRGDQSSKALIY